MVEFRLGETDFRPLKADFGYVRAHFRAVRIDFKPEADDCRCQILGLGRLD